jgi:hypothetical protein
MWNLIQAFDDSPDDYDGSVRLDVVEGVTGPRAKEKTEIPSARPVTDGSQSNVYALPKIWDKSIPCS